MCVVTCVCVCMCKNTSKTDKPMVQLAEKLFALWHGENWTKEQELEHMEQMNQHEDWVKLFVAADHVENVNTN